jgi:hypothetical protein
MQPIGVVPQNSSRILSTALKNMIRNRLVSVGDPMFRNFAHVDGKIAEGGVACLRRRSGKNAERMPWLL